MFMETSDPLTPKDKETPKLWKTVKSFWPSGIVICVFILLCLA